MRKALTLALILSVASPVLTPATAQELTPLPDSVSSTRDAGDDGRDGGQDSYGSADDLGSADRVAAQTGDDWSPTAYPVEFVSLGSKGIGVPVRATITAFGPILLSKVLGLNDTQESSLGLIFHYADKRGLTLLDLKDLRSVIQYLTSAEGKADLEGIGGVSKQTAGVILRALVNLEAEGGDTFFGEPEIDMGDLLRTAGGQGVVTLFELGDQAARLLVEAAQDLGAAVELRHLDAEAVEDAGELAGDVAAADDQDGFRQRVEVEDVVRYQPLVGAGQVGADRHPIGSVEEGPTHGGGVDAAPRREGLAVAGELDGRRADLCLPG